MDSLPGRQLPVAVEAVLRSVKQIGGQNDDDQHPGNEKTSDRQSLPKKGEKHILGKNTIYENEKIFPQFNHAIVQRQKPYQLFENIFDDE